MYVLRGSIACTASMAKSCERGGGNKEESQKGQILEEKKAC